MKVFQCSDSSSPAKSEIVSVIKGLYLECGREVHEDSDLSFGQLHAEDFFYEEADVYLWGRIFLSSMTKADFSKLESDFQFLKKKKPFHKIQIKVYCPSVEAELQQSEGMESEIFQYLLIQTKGERAMLIEKMEPLKAVIPGRLSAGSALPAQTEYNFSKQSQITRNELAELIDLSLDLKRL